MFERMLYPNQIELIEIDEKMIINNRNPGQFKSNKTHIFKLNENSYLVAFKCGQGECLSRAIKYYNKKFELSTTIWNEEHLLNVIPAARISVIDNNLNVEVRGNTLSLL